MYFPFLTCEVKCGAAALDVADRQNAHSMTIAVRSVIELYRAVKCEKELNREILAFSISHDHRSVRIYGHYAVIDDNQTTFYRHPIKTLDITSEEGKDKWTTYKFTKNVYDVWMPTHLKRICSAVDQLPSSLNFQVSEGSEVQSEAATGLSQDMGSLLSDPDNVDLVSQEDGELNLIPQTVTPDTSVSKGVGQGAAKRAKKTRITKEQTGRRKERLHLLYNCRVSAACFAFSRYGSPLLAFSLQPDLSLNRAVEKQRHLFTKIPPSSRL